MSSETPVYRRLGIAGRLVVAGLLMQVISLLWSHPTAFFLFLFAGVLPVVVGILVYLTAIAGLAVVDEERS